MSQTKFTTKSELMLFKALQKFGRLSQKRLAKKTTLPRTTIEYVYPRLQQRDFFDMRATPKLEKFIELPIGVLSFIELHPARVRELKMLYSKREEVRTMIVSSREIVMILMHQSKDRLAELMFEIMKEAKVSPILHILSPEIVKMDLTIPDVILDALYSVQDARRKK